MHGGNPSLTAAPLPSRPSPSRPRSIPECQRAVRAFFDRHSLRLEVTEIDDYGAFLQKTDGRRIDGAWYLEFNDTRSTADAGGAT